MAEACRALGVPVVSGNVSFYNETEGRAVHPTPSVAMVGVADSIAAHPVSWFRARRAIASLLLGDDRRELGGSAYLRLLFSASSRAGRRRSTSRRRRGSATCCGALALAGLLHTAHDVAEGGLLVALAEATFARGLGVRLDARRRSALAVLRDAGAGGDRGGAAGRRIGCWRWRRRSACRRARSAWSEAMRLEVVVGSVTAIAARASSALRTRAGAAALPRALGRA